MRSLRCLRLAARLSRLRASIQSGTSPPAARIWLAMGRSAGASSSVKKVMASPEGSQHTKWGERL